MRVRDFRVVTVIVVAAQACAAPFATRVRNIKAAPARVAAMPADVEVYQLDAEEELTRVENATAIAEQAVISEVNRWVTEHGGRTFDRKDVYGTKVGYLSFRQWAEGALEQIAVEIDGRRRTNRQSVAEWRWLANMETWHERLGADFVLVVRFRDANATGGRVAMNFVSPNQVWARRVGTACVVDMRDGRIVACHQETSGSGKLQTQAEARDAVEDLLKGLFPGAE